MCGSEGANDCEFLTSCENQCIAWLLPSAEGGGNSNGYAVGKTVRDAERSAR